MAPSVTFWLVVCGTLFQCQHYDQARLVPATPLRKVTILTHGFVNAMAYNVQGLDVLGPAFDTGFRGLVASNLSGFSFRHVYLTSGNIPTCLDMISNIVDVLSQWYYKNLDEQDILVLLTPGCQEIGIVNRLASEWNVLLISMVATFAEINDKTASPTWITTSPTAIPPTGAVYFNMLRRYGWTNVYVIHDMSSAPAFVEHSKAVRARIMAMGWQLNTLTALSSADTPVNYRDILTHFSTISRVFLFFGNAHIFRQFVVWAARLNMTNGEYVYVAFRPVDHSILGKLHWKYDQDDDELARRGFPSTLLVTPASDRFAEPAFSRYVDQWTNISAARYNHSANPALGKDLPYSYMVAAHGAFDVLSQVFASHDPNSSGDYRDGASFARHFWSRQFNTTFGEFTFDRFGVRQLEMVVRYFDPQRDIYQTFLRQASPQALLNEVLTPMFAGTAHLPPNKPTCGFTGSSPQCRKPEAIAVPVSIGVVVAIVLVCGGLFWRLLAWRVDKKWWLLRAIDDKGAA